LMSLDQLPR